MFDFMKKMPKQTTYKIAKDTFHKNLARHIQEWFKGAFNKILATSRDGQKPGH